MTTYSSNTSIAQTIVKLDHSTGNTANGQTLYTVPTNRRAEVRFDLFQEGTNAAGAGGNLANPIFLSFIRPGVFASAEYFRLYPHNATVGSVAGGASPTRSERTYQQAVRHLVSGDAIVALRPTGNAFNLIAQITEFYNTP